VQTFPAGASPFSVQIADINGDGDPDVAVASEGSSDVTVYLGDRAGGFYAQRSFACGTAPRSLAIGDVNADGRLDLVTANSGSGNASVLLQQ
jgi:hypothetical protein